MSYGMLGRVFKIFDCHGRYWGTFIVNEETNFFGNYNIHGTLVPSDEFEVIRPLFTQHELKMEEDGDVEEISVNQLFELDPYLVDKETNKRVNICGALFITENFLVTCGLVNPNTELGP